MHGVANKVSAGNFRHFTINDSQVSGSPSSLYDSYSVMSPEVSIGVPVCNRFASLSDECATPVILSQVFWKTMYPPV